MVLGKGGRERLGGFGDGREEKKRQKITAAVNENELAPVLPIGGAQSLPLVTPLLPNVADGGRADNGNTAHLYFMAMGQGDCTFIISPNNKIFIVDIGSDGRQRFPKKNNANVDSFTKLNELIEQNNIFGQDKVAEALIITHSDGDHHNKLSKIQTYGVSTKRIYYSNTFDSYSSVSAKTGEETLSSSRALMTKLIAKQKSYQLSGVSYTTDEETPADPPQTYSAAANSPAPVKEYRALYDQKGSNIKDIPTTVTQDENEPFEPYYDKDKGMVVYEEASGFSIRILVGNYRNCGNAAKLAEPDANKQATLTNTKMRELWQKNYLRLRDHNITEQRTIASDVNRASIVVHIRYQINPDDVDSAENYIICGDATGEPLDMIRTQYPNLENVTILQAPHHGSASNFSPNQDFFKQMWPQIAVYSCPYGKIATHMHPRLVSVQRMQESMSFSPDMLSNYGAWHNKIYYETVNIPYRIYMTGWMLNGYYHYIAPLNTATNHPIFQDEISDQQYINVFKNPLPKSSTFKIYDDQDPNTLGDMPPDVWQLVLDEGGNVINGSSGGGSVNSDSGGGDNMSDDENDPISDDGMSDDEDPVSDGDDGDDDGDDSDFEG